MFFELPLIWFFFVSLLILVLAYWIGSRVAAWESKGEKKARDYNLFIEGMLLSMLLGFTFSQAEERFEKRKESFKKEVNITSTVVNNAGLYPDSLASILKSDLKLYIEARLDYYNALSDKEKATESLKRSSEIGLRIFSNVSKFAKNPANQVFSMQMIPQLNNLLDISTEIDIYRKSFIPVAILRLLYLVSIVVIFLMGFNQYGTSYTHLKNISFSLLVSMTFVLIIDLQDFSRGRISHEHRLEYLSEIRDLLK